MTTYTVTKGDFTLAQYQTDENTSSVEAARMAITRAANAAGTDEAAFERVLTLTDDDFVPGGDDVTVHVEHSPLDQLADLRAESIAARERYETAVLDARAAGHSYRAVAKAAGVVVATIQHIERKRA